MMITDMVALRMAGKTLFSQMILHGQLARIEWAEEKNRLLKMFIAVLLGFACLLCLMLFTGMLVIALSWSTEYRILSLLVVIALYGIGTAMAWKYLDTLAKQGDQAFAATREELSADADLLKNNL